jgi:hypothetical protein
VLHHEVQRALVIAEVEDGGDEGAVHRRGEARFVEELGAARRIVEVLADRLEGHQLGEPMGRVETRFPNLPHAAGGEEEEELVTAEGISRLEAASRSHGLIV